ncbi:MAG: T9SS type A sorting domain-containing protein, partial [Draconibacterium sp.]
ALFGTSSVSDYKYSIFCTYTTDVSKSAEISTDIQQQLVRAEMKFYPNPFTTKLHFEFMSTEKTHAQIDIFDLTGRKIESIFDSKIDENLIYNVDFNPSDATSTIYIYRVVIGEKIFNGKVVHQK